jgi:hypothetical protein
VDHQSEVLMTADPHDDSRFPLAGMRSKEPPTPRINSRLPKGRRGLHPVALVLAAVAALVVTFYALSAVLGG